MEEADSRFPSTVRPLPRDCRGFASRLPGVLSITAWLGPGVRYATQLDRDATAAAEAGEEGYPPETKPENAQLMIYRSANVSFEATNL